MNKNTEPRACAVSTGQFRKYILSRFHSKRHLKGEALREWHIKYLHDLRKHGGRFYGRPA